MPHTVVVVTLVQVLLNEGYSTGSGGRRHGRASHALNIVVIVSVAATLCAVQSLCRVGNPHRILKITAYDCSYLPLVLSPLEEKQVT